MLSFVVEHRPIGKGRPRFVKTRQGMRAVTPKPTRDFEEVVADAALVALKAAGLKAPATPNGPVSISLRAVHRRPSRPDADHPCRQTDERVRAPGGGGRPDLDNVIKAVLDALNGVLWRDDAQVVQIMAEGWFAARGEDACVEVEMVEVRR